MTLDDLEKMLGDLDIFPMVPLLKNDDACAVGYKNGTIRVFKKDGDLVDISRQAEQQFTKIIVTDRLKVLGDL